MGSTRQFVEMPLLSSVIKTENILFISSIIFANTAQMCYAYVRRFAARIAIGGWSMVHQLDFIDWRRRVAANGDTS